MKAKRATETEVRVKILPGPASPAQKQAWRRLWQKLMAEVKVDEHECQTKPWGTSFRR